METLTWLSLGLQLGALCSIVGALLLYLLKKVKGPESMHNNGSKTVLVTSLDTALGLQIATHLSSRGWRVVGGCRAGGLGSRLASSWLAAHTPTDEALPPPKLATVELDVAREDVMEQAARATAQHLPAGEYGVWAVVNTAGVGGGAGAECWEAVLRCNVLGALRVARTFAPLLAAACKSAPAPAGTPRLFYIGLSSDTELQDWKSAACDEASPAVAAARWAVCGAGAALRALLRRRGVHVAVLHAPALSSADLFAPPSLVSEPTSRPQTPSSEGGSNSCAVSMGGEAAEYSARVLPPAALRLLETALAAPHPSDTYRLPTGHNRLFVRGPSLRIM